MKYHVIETITYYAALFVALVTLCISFVILGYGIFLHL